MASHSPPPAWEVIKDPETGQSQAASDDEFDMDPSPPPPPTRKRKGGANNGDVLRPRKVQRIGDRQGTQPQNAGDNPTSHTAIRHLARDLTGDPQSTPWPAPQVKEKKRSEITASSRIKPSYEPPNCSGLSTSGVTRSKAINKPATNSPSVASTRTPFAPPRTHRPKSSKARNSSPFRIASSQIATGSKKNLDNRPPEPSPSVYSRKAPSQPNVPKLPQLRPVNQARSLSASLDWHTDPTSTAYLPRTKTAKPNAPLAQARRRKTVGHIEKAANLDTIRLGKEKGKRPSAGNRRNTVDVLPTEADDVLEITDSEDERHVIPVKLRVKPKPKPTPLFLSRNQSSSADDCIEILSSDDALRSCAPKRKDKGKDKEKPVGSQSQSQNPPEVIAILESDEEQIQAFAIVPPVLVPLLSSPQPKHSDVSGLEPASAKTDLVPDVLHHTPADDTLPPPDVLPDDYYMESGPERFDQEDNAMDVDFDFGVEDALHDSPVEDGSALPGPAEAASLPLATPAKVACGPLGSPVDFTSDPDLHAGPVDISPTTSQALEDNSDTAATIEDGIPPEFTPPRQAEEPPTKETTHLAERSPQIDLSRYAARTSLPTLASPSGAKPTNSTGAKVATAKPPFAGSSAPKSPFSSASSGTLSTTAIPTRSVTSPPRLRSFASQRALTLDVDKATAGKSIPTRSSAPKAPSSSSSSTTALPTPAVSLTAIVPRRLKSYESQRPLSLDSKCASEDFTAKVFERVNRRIKQANRKAASSKTVPVLQSTPSQQSEKDLEQAAHAARPSLDSNRTPSTPTRTSPIIKAPPSPAVSRPSPPRETLADTMNRARRKQIAMMRQHGQVTVNPPHDIIDLTGSDDEPPLPLEALLKSAQALKEIWPTASIPSPNRPMKPSPSLKVEEPAFEINLNGAEHRSRMLRELRSNLPPGRVGRNVASRRPTQTHSTASSVTPTLQHTKALVLARSQSSETVLTGSVTTTSESNTVPEDSSLLVNIPACSEGNEAAVVDPSRLLSSQAKSTNSERLAGEPAAPSTPIVDEQPLVNAPPAESLTGVPLLAALPDDLAALDCLSFQHPFNDESKQRPELPEVVPPEETAIRRSPAGSLIHGSEATAGPVSNNCSPDILLRTDRNSTHLAVDSSEKSVNAVILRTTGETGTTHLDSSLGYDWMEAEHLPENQIQAQADGEIAGADSSETSVYIEIAQTTLEVETMHLDSAPPNGKINMHEEQIPTQVNNETERVTVGEMKPLSELEVTLDVQRMEASVIDDSEGGLVDEPNAFDRTEVVQHESSPPTSDDPVTESADDEDEECESMLAYPGSAELRAYNLASPDPESAGDEVQTLTVDNLSALSATIAPTMIVQGLSATVAATVIVSSARTERRSSRRSSRSSRSSSNAIDTAMAPGEDSTPPSLSILPPQDPDTYGQGRNFGGVIGYSWEDFREATRNTPPVHFLAKNLPHEMQDYINDGDAYFRMHPQNRFMFEGMIADNTAEDEPDAPPIQILNDINPEDEPTPPWEFYYTNHMWHGEGVPLPDIKNLRSCGCRGPCDPKSKTCACLKRHQASLKQYEVLSSGFIYDQKGRLKERSLPIYECNDLCGCDDDCPNRLVQHGRKCLVNIKKTLERGWGVFAGAQRIPKGTFIGIYAGELLTDAEGEERGITYNKVGRTYLFDIDFHHLRGNDPQNWTSKYVVDAFNAGNFTRFLNHSCDPNCTLEACYINESNIDKPLLVCFTQRDVRPGEELCFSYTGPRDDEDNVDVVSDKDEAVYVACRCGAANCTKILFT